MRLQFFNVKLLLARWCFWSTDKVLTGWYLTQYFYSKLALSFLSWLLTDKSAIVFAAVHETGEDITLSIQRYYTTDPLQSIGSLHRWLKRFKVEAKTITIVFTRGNELYASRLSLDSSREQLTGKSIVDENLGLACLPHTVLLRYKQD